MRSLGGRDKAGFNISYKAVNMIRELISSLKRSYIIYKERSFYKNVLRDIKDPLFIDGYPETKNFGDALNLFIGEYLSGRPVFPSRFVDKKKYDNEPFYSVIGSICQQSKSNTIVWGSGFISSKYKNSTFVKPHRLVAVRGPLTREVYIHNNIDCPQIYGDPALLLPLIYNPKVEIEYEYGFIPHYTDMDNEWSLKLKELSNVLTISMMIGANYIECVQKLKSCEKVVVSSLHGLILCHAYGIPVCQVKLSENLIGGNFKFDDYLLSVNKPKKKPRDLTKQHVEIKDLEFDHDLIDINLRPLINSCPFIKEDIKLELLDKAVYYDNFKI